MMEDGSLIEFRTGTAAVGSYYSYTGTGTTGTSSIVPVLLVLRVVATDSITVVDSLHVDLLVARSRSRSS